MTDEAAQRRAHAIFDPIATEFLGRPGVDIGPMFGSEGLRIRGKIFALVDYDGELMMKIPEGRADELVTEGSVERVEMRGRRMREWVVVKPDAGDRWRPLMAEAFAYVDEITP